MTTSTTAAAPTSSTASRRTRRIGCIDPRVKLETSYDFAYWTYALGKAENSLNHRADLSLEGHPTRRLTLKVADEFSRAEDPGLPLAPRRGGAADRHLRQRRRRAHRREHRAARVRRPRLHVPLGAASISTRRSRRPTYPALYDGAEHDAQGFTAFAVTRRDDLRFTGRAQLFTAGPQATDANRWDIGATYSPTVGWRHQFLPTLEATADAGPVFYDSLGGVGNIVDGAGDARGAALGLDLARLGAASLEHAVVARLGRLRARPPRRHRRRHGAVGRRRLRAGRLPLSREVRRARRLRLLPQRRRRRISRGRTTASPPTRSSIGASSITSASARTTRCVGRRPVPASSVAGGQFPNVTRNIVGLRLLAVLGADARPPRREVHP